MYECPNVKQDKKARKPTSGLHDIGTAMLIAKDFDGLIILCTTLKSDH